MMTENHLVEIPHDELPCLLNLYANRKKEASSWNLLQNYINWLAIDPAMDNVKIFSLNGDWNDGTFIIQHGNTFMFNTLNDNQDRLLNALRCTDDLETHSATDYNSFNDFVHRVKPTVDRFMMPIGISVDITVIWYHLPREDALSFQVDVPDGVTVAPLTQDNVECINNLWAYRSASSEGFISRLIRFNLHRGLFDRDGHLLAWCVQMPMGFIGLLQVKEDHRRKGLGSLVIRAMAKELAEKGIEVTSSVVENNIASRQMFEKLGFKEIDQVHWVRRPKLKQK